MHDDELVLGSVSGAHCAKDKLVSGTSQTWKFRQGKTRNPIDDTHSRVDAKSKTK